MSPDQHLPFDKPERTLRPDRRPLPRASENRLRVKRTQHRGEA